MTACLSSGGGGAAAYSFELEKVKSPPSSSTTTRATSPSSTLSESSNSPLAISTRKPRTQRKRPNQTYNEAAALLSTAYPSIFSSNLSSSKQKTHASNSQFYGTVKSPLLSDNDEASDLLLPYESIEEPDFLFHPTIQSKSDFFSEQKEVNSGGSYGGGVGEIEKFDFSDEFDAESILDEEIEEGIDSIMGTVVESNSNSNLGIYESRVPGINRGGGRSSTRIGKLEQMMMINSWNRSSNGFKSAGNIPLGLGLRSALRENDDPNLWRFHTVDFEQISPRIQTTTTETAIATVNDDKSDGKKPIGGEKSKKKKKKKMTAVATPLITESKSSEDTTEETSPKRTGPLLKLDYDSVLEAWSDKTSPFSDDILGSEATGIDVNARLAQIDLFGDSGMREASVLRYKEKRRTRLFSKKIRYQVRKVNADQRPRMKGRFVRRPNVSTPSGQRQQG